MARHMNPRELLLADIRRVASRVGEEPAPVVWSAFKLRSTPSTT